MYIDSKAKREWPKATDMHRVVHTHTYCIYIYICIYIYMFIYTWAKSTDMHRTGWRKLIGSPKLQIIFHQRATKYRSLLRKMTYKDKGSYESSPPCICILTYANMYYICVYQ